MDSLFRVLAQRLRRFQEGNSDFAARPADTKNLESMVHTVKTSRNWSSSAGKLHLPNEFKA
jgi:hypothetical protein